jgi:hypothetical protein
MKKAMPLAFTPGNVPTMQKMIVAENDFTLPVDELRKSKGAE